MRVLVQTRVECALSSSISTLFSVAKERLGPAEGVFPYVHGSAACTEGALEQQYVESIVEVREHSFCDVVKRIQCLRHI